LRVGMVMKSEDQCDGEAPQSIQGRNVALENRRGFDFRRSLAQGVVPSFDMS